jgi:ribosomal protein L25 (general stress protein Ctc)
MYLWLRKASQRPKRDDVYTAIVYIKDRSSALYMNIRSSYSNKMHSKETNTCNTLLSYFVDGIHLLSMVKGTKLGWLWRVWPSPDNNF